MENVVVEGKGGRGAGRDRFELERLLEKASQVLAVAERKLAAQAMPADAVHRIRNHMHRLSLGVHMLVRVAAKQDGNAQAPQMKRVERLIDHLQLVVGNLPI